MKKKLLSMLLATVMTIGVVSGCGAKSEPAVNGGRAEYKRGYRGSRG